jgi:hypothetical protein
VSEAAEPAATVAIDGAAEIIAAAGAAGAPFHHCHVHGSPQSQVARGATATADTHRARRI